MQRADAPVSSPVVLSIAGSDSGGGAGIQADLKTIEAGGGFGTTAITSVTAQNTTGVQGTHLLPTEEIAAQIRAVRDDFDVAAVKTGMLATSDVIDLVTERAPGLPNLVVDPVMVSASGDRLLEPEAEDAYEELIAEAALVTPNADEAAVLTGRDIDDPDAAAEAGRDLVEMGADAALVKGGHVPGDEVVDVLVTADSVTTVRHDRIDTEATHGSGCTLSSAIATRLAHGPAALTTKSASIRSPPASTPTTVPPRHRGPPTGRPPRIPHPPHVCRTVRRNAPRRIPETRKQPAKRPRPRSRLIGYLRPSCVKALFNN
jgi:hydroxymethylpyrimidine/phosphomethylpyrimidine kinase